MILVFRICVQSGLLVGESVSIPGEQDAENFDGSSFAIVLAEVSAHSQPGSYQISKAFEEGLIGDKRR